MIYTKKTAQQSYNKMCVMWRLAHIPLHSQAVFVGLAASESWDYVRRQAHHITDSKFCVCLTQQQHRQHQQNHRSRISSYTDRHTQYTEKVRMRAAMMTKKRKNEREKNAEINVRKTHSNLMAVKQISWH